MDRPEWQEYLHKNQNGYEVDLWEKIKDQLSASGIKQDQLEIAGINTFTSKEYYSYRREKKTGKDEGRFLTVAGFRPLP